MKTILIAVILLSIMSLANQPGKIKYHGLKVVPDPTDCLHPDGRETNYNLTLKPFQQIKIYNKVGDAGKERVISVFVNSILLKKFNNRKIESPFEYQNTTLQEQSLAIKTGMHFKKRDLADSAIELQCEDNACLMKYRSGGRNNPDGGRNVCDCTGSEPDYNDAYLIIQKF